MGSSIDGFCLDEDCLQGIPSALLFPLVKVDRHDSRWMWEHLVSGRWRGPISLLQETFLSLSQRRCFQIYDTVWGLVLAMFSPFCRVHQWQVVGQHWFVLLRL